MQRVHLNPFIQAEFYLINLHNVNIFFVLFFKKLLVILRIYLFLIVDNITNYYHNIKKNEEKEKQDKIDICLSLCNYYCGIVYNHLFHVPHVIKMAMNIR
jgi:hypothetical protein